MGKYYDVIFYGAFFLTSLAFPLWVSTYARKRGRPGWSKIAFFSTFVGLGFLGGLAALTAAAAKPGIIESDELEITSDDSIVGIPRTKKEKAEVFGTCPKCGSNMVNRSIMVVDPITRERTKSTNQERLGVTGAAIFIVIGAAIMIYTLFRFFTLGYPVGYLAAAGFGGYFVYLGIRPLLARKQEKGKQVIEVFNCARCKSEWDGLEVKN